MNFIEIEDIKIHIEKKRIKNFNLTVRAPSGEVKLTYPYHVRKRDLNIFIQRKLPWIKKQQQKYHNIKVPEPLMYKSKEKIYYLGKEKELNVKESAKRFVEIKDDHLNLYVLKTDTRKERERLINEFYRGELYEVLIPLVNKWEPIMQVRVNETRIKNMKTLWGSCNINARRIWLNLKLANYDVKCIEYVVVHEMVHLLERLHSPKFYKLMDRFLPHWRDTEDKLNKKHR